MSIPLDILTVLKPHFPPSGQVLAQGARINEERWREVATQTGDVEVAWEIDNLSQPITRSDIIGLMTRIRSSVGAGSPSSLSCGATASRALAGDHGSPTSRTSSALAST